MVHEYKLIEVEEAHTLRDRLDLLDDAYYLDRSKYRPIRGVENHEKKTLSILMGIMIGSLPEIWPLKTYDSLINNYNFQIFYSNNCRVYIRPSGTEPLIRILVEAKNQKRVHSLSTEITSKL